MIRGLQSYNLIRLEAKRPMNNEQESRSQQQISTHLAPLILPFKHQPSKRSDSLQAPKNRSWTAHQHLHYLIFLELNKDKVKSKLVRHSNGFFKEMADFVQSKTDIQCRSHNHKYEQKYKYPYRILKEERAKLEAEGLSFTGALENFRQKIRNYQKNQIEGKRQSTKLIAPVNVSTGQVDIQTDLRGVNVVFITQEQFESMQINNNYYHMFNPITVQYASNYPQQQQELHFFRLRR